MTDIHGNTTKWDLEQPDPREGMVCEECDGKGYLEQDDEYQRPIDVTCPDCQGTGKPR